MDKSLYITLYINQANADLIGYQAFYKSGNNQFYETLEEISMGTEADPLVEVKQVGKLRQRPRFNQRQ